MVLQKRQKTNNSFHYRFKPFSICFESIVQFLQQFVRTIDFIRFKTDVFNKLFGTRRSSNRIIIFVCLENQTIVLNLKLNL